MARSSRPGFSCSPASHRLAAPPPPPHARAGPHRARASPLTALLTIAFVAGLLAAVTTGLALCRGGPPPPVPSALFAYGNSRHPARWTARRIDAVLHTTPWKSPARSFALFVAATSFTLVLRGFGTDRLLTPAMIAVIPFGARPRPHPGGGACWCLPPALWCSTPSRSSWW